MAEVIARVIAGDGKPEGGLVELSNGETNVSGRVAAVSENEFLVNWEDGARTVENQSDYELVVTAAPKVPAGFLDDEPLDLGEHVTTEDFPVVNRNAKVAQENPAQPAGWAVPPMDANAHPGGELMAIEQEKRAETAQWEDAQNRPPVDAENPAQPAGFAVPPATGGPIPGQGADGLMMAARVYSEDVTGQNGLVQLANGNLRVAGRILASDDESFIVAWEDERRTVEAKSDYDLVIAPGINEGVTAAAAPFGPLDEQDTLKRMQENLKRMDLEGQAGHAPTVPNPEMENEPYRTEMERIDRGTAEIFRDLPGSADLNTDQLNDVRRHRGIDAVPFRAIEDRGRGMQRAENELKKKKQEEDETSRTIAEIGRSEGVQPMRRPAKKQQ